MWTVLALILAGVVLFRRRPTDATTATTHDDLTYTPLPPTRRDVMTQTVSVTISDDATQTTATMTLDETSMVATLHATVQRHVPITTAMTQTPLQPAQTQMTQTFPQPAQTQTAPQLVQQPATLAWLAGIQSTGQQPPLPSTIASAPPPQPPHQPPPQPPAPTYPRPATAVRPLIPQTHNDWHKTIPDWIHAHIVATSNGRYPDNFLDERDRVRDVMRALGVRCPRCIGAAFDERGTNHRWLRFKCPCTEPNIVVLRYRCRSTRREPRRLGWIETYCRSTV